MKTRRPATCTDCYRPIPEGTEVGYRRGRGVRHLGGCEPITTEELAAGRARFAESEARRPDRPQSFAKHDAANAAWAKP